MIKGGRDPIFLSGQPLSPPFLISPSLLASSRASQASFTLVYSPCSYQTQVGARVRAEKPWMPPKDALWSTSSRSRPLTPRLPTTSSLPLAPVEAPRRPRHATMSGASSPLLSLTRPRVPDAARLGQCMASHARAPEPCPAPALSPQRPTPPPRALRTTPSLFPWPPRPFLRVPVGRVHGEPWPRHIRPP